MTARIEEIRQRFVEAAGNATQSLGIGRVLGQVYAHVYFSRAPQTLDDLAGSLGISKGAASMTVRQLEQWGALRRVWVKGERKDHYEAADEFGRILRRALLDMIGRKMEISAGLLDEAETALRRGLRERATGNGDLDFLRGRVERLQAFRARAQRLWESSILTMLLK
jgi:DNA-binding transcriptional regulator GbsR (MarR family)